MCYTMLVFIVPEARLRRLKPIAARSRHNEATISNPWRKTKMSEVMRTDGQ